MRDPLSAWRAGVRWPLIVIGSVAALILAIAVCEAIGWPFLVGPVERRLSATLDRRVDFGAKGSANGGQDGADDRTRIRLIGSVRVRAPRIEIGSPEWSQEPYTLLAEDAYLKLGYVDLWRAWRGEPLHIEALEAGDLDARLERRADGRATWQFGKAPKAEPSDKATTLPSFGSLRVASGALKLRDEVAPAQIDARFALSDGAAGETGAAAGGGSAGSASAAASGPGAGGRAGASDAARSASAANAGGIAIRAGGKASGAAAAASAPVTLAPGESGLKVVATGTYRKLPVRIDLKTSGVLSLLVEGKDAVAQPVRLAASVGRAELSFDGSTTDPLHFAGLKGRFSLAGPSLAAVGDPLGITLPTTPAFKTRGTLVKDGTLWKAVFDDASIGASRLNGAFTYDARRKVPLLAGRLGGSRLLLSDLGPAVGGPAGGTAGTAGAAEKKEIKAPGRVIPDREFDLPSLRAMDANVLIDIAELNTGTDVLAVLRPLRGHLLLADGVLTVSDLEARTAKGRMAGYLQLDGRGKQARWTTDLRLLGVDLAQFLRLERSDGKPPYLSGKLDAQVKVTGSGRSTAEILASLGGNMRMHVREGAISHLVVEAAGIDLAQALGLMFKGDEALPIQCNVADFGVDKGVIKPKVFVINTRDSTIWLDGTASLRTEKLDVRAVVSPKDFSPLTLRTPVHVRGTFGDPSVSLELGKLAGKAAAAGLLALLNPLAAIIPFIDTGSDKEAKQAGADCANLVRSQGSISQPVRAPKSVPAPPPASAPR